MSKIAQIIAREYITRVRKPVFIIMSIIGPLLFGALLVVPIWLSMIEDHEEKTIAVMEIDRYDHPVPDSLMLFKGKFETKPLLKFKYLGDVYSLKQAEGLASTEYFYGIVVIRYNVIVSDDTVSVEYLSAKQPSLGIEEQIESDLEKAIYKEKLVANGLPRSVLPHLRSNVHLVVKIVDEKGTKSKTSSHLQIGVGYASGFLIYMFIFFFGAQVMRGVAEEKSNRIIEVIITSVKPFQLMMGKIIGIGLVGLTQFLAWLILTFFIYQFTSNYIIKEQFKQIQTEQVQRPTDLFQAQPTVHQATQPINQPSLEDVELTGIMRDIQDIDFGVIIGVFLFYFIFGFMLYGAMFAAIGAAVDSETDTQQFMLPVTIPLIISIIVMMNAIYNPEGQVAFWFSLIPFTSPIVMMARIGYIIQVSQLILSGLILIATTLLFIWIAGRIYKTGILLYGKKITYRDMFKWIKKR